MPRPNASSALAQRRQDLRPATRAALKLYAMGGAKTIPEAAAIYGLAPISLYIAKRTLDGQEIISQMDAAVTEKAVDAAALIEQLSVKMVQKVADLALKGGSEGIQLAAAKDLLDRNPSTSKTQKVAVEGFSIGPDDAKHLASAMVAAAEVRRSVGDTARGNTLKLVGPGTEVQPATEEK